MYTKKETINITKETFGKLVLCYETQTEMNELDLRNVKKHLNYIPCLYDSHTVEIFRKEIIGCNVVTPTLVGYCRISDANRIIVFEISKGD